MLYWLCLLFVSTSLFAQSTATSVATTRNITGGQPAIYVIDPMERGKDIFNMVATCLQLPLKTKTSQVAIQTLRNGLISDVFAIDPAENYTLFIVQYYSRPNFLQYIVIPIEQIIEVVYSTKAISGNFASTITTGILSVFEVDFIERAKDIIDIFAKLVKPGGTYAAPNFPNSQVALQTTLTGSYNPPLTNGLIPNVKTISLNGSVYGTLLLVSYRLSNNQQPDFFVIVPLESIYAINYYQFGS